MTIRHFAKNAMALAVATASCAGMAAEPQTEQYSGAIEEVVVKGTLTRYSATKSDTPIVETSRSVTIETRQQLEDKGARTLSDAYVYAAGVTGETYGFATRGDWVKVRGLDAPQYQDSLQSLFGNYNNARPHIYTLEQVEILKGPVSVLYGQGSPGGLVNIVSKRPQEDSKSELVVEYGDNNYRQIASDSTGAIDSDGKWLYRMIAVKKDSDTQVDFVNEDALVFAPSITWRPTADTNITLLANYTENESRAGAQFLPLAGTLMPGVSGQRIESGTFLGEPGFDRYNTENKSLTLLADHQINDIWSVEATARMTRGESDYQQSWAHFTGDVTGDGIGDRTTLDGVNYARTFYIAPSSSDQKALDVRFKANFSTGEIEHNVMIGGQFQDVTLDDGDSVYLAALGFPGSGSESLGTTYWINVFDPVYGNVPPQSLIDASSYNPEPTNTRDLGFYINDQISYQNWRFVLGLRRDRVENDNSTSVQKDSATSYSFGALYQFDNGLSPYINYAESFQPVVGADNITGTLKKPREGRQYEAGFKYQPRAFRGLLTLAYFDIEESNLDNPLSLPGAPSQQEGVGKVDGIEFEGIAALGDFTVELNLSRIDTESPDGFQFASIPEDQASTWVGYKPVDGALAGFKTGIGVRYMGASYGGADLLRTPSYTLGDLMLGYEFETWDLALNIRNLADKDHQASCLSRGDCFPGERRTVVAQARYKF